MNTNYNSWFEKYNGKEIDGLHVTAKPSTNKCSFIFSLQNNIGKKYIFGLQTISAVSRDGMELPCYLSETEVDKDVMSWVSHVSQTMSC